MGPAKKNRSGQIEVVMSGSIVTHSNGLPFDVAGRLVVSSDTPARFQNGIPFNASGRVCVGDGGPVPSFSQDFRTATALDPRFTFSRSTPAWYWQNGILVEAGIDEPVFEDGALRLEDSQTEFIPNNTVLSSTNADWIATKVDDPQIPYAYEFEFVSGTTTGLITTNVPTYPATNTEPSSGQYVIGVAVKKTVNDAFIRSGSSSAAAVLVLNTKTGDVVHRGANRKIRSLILGDGG